MTDHFSHGQKLACVTGPWVQSEGTCTFHKIGNANCVSITVVEEDAGCWAIAKYSDRAPSKVNLAMMEEVDLLKD